MTGKVMPDTYGCHSRNGVANALIILSCIAFYGTIALLLASFPSGDGGAASVVPSSYIQDTTE